MKLRRLSLLWKIWLSTSVLLTVFFAATGWILQRRAAESTRHSLEEEVRASFQAYESVWRARQEMLGAVAKILSSLPNVRAAFGTGDQATIRDSASEIWQTISERLKQTAFFVVTDPRGATVAALGDRAPAGLPEIWTAVAAMRDKFPSQVAGFDVREGQLFHLVLTPVYVASSRGDALISVLVAGFPVHRQAAGELKGATGGSEFVFFSGGRIFASTLNEDATQTLTQALPRSSAGGVARAGAAEYYVETRLLPGLDGASVGSLGIFRSFEAARQRIATLRRDLIVIWLAAMGAGLALTYVLARLIVRPVEQLDHAAAQIARQNYDYRLNASVAESGDELGRLAATFNAMCDSLQRARSELIRQERISTIGRLTNSIVHDLRNPLAAIYGGAEMMVDADLPAGQVKRLAQNIYHASRRIQTMLQDLLNVSRGGNIEAEPCLLKDVVDAAAAAQREAAAARGVKVEIDVPDDLELPLQRARVERVFENLIGNAIDVMPAGGAIRIRTKRAEAQVVVEVEDTGPGIPAEIREKLFQPFVTHGKRHGLGLGLALSRQTILDHGGEMWASGVPGGGARFSVRLPRTPAARAVLQ